MTVIFSLERFVSFTQFVTFYYNLRFSMKVSIVSINFFFRVSYNTVLDIPTNLSSSNSFG